MRALLRLRSVSAIPVGIAPARAERVDEGDARLGLMGMHTIRWRSGATDSGQIPCLPMLGLRQCALSPFPACWGCRIVHRSLAISMALAAVPGDCGGSQRCADLSSVQRKARRCAGRECSRGARSTREACAEHEKNLLFSAARSARAEAARRSRARRREV